MRSDVAPEGQEGSHLTEDLVRSPHLVAVDLEHEPARFADAVVSSEVRPDLPRIEMTGTVVLAPESELRPAQVEPGHDPSTRRADRALRARFGQPGSEQEKPQPGLGS